MKYWEGTGGLEEAEVSPINKCNVTSSAWHRFTIWGGTFVLVREVSIG